MKIDKAIKDMPWPEPFVGIPNQHFKMTLAWTVVNHERLLAVTFTWNTNGESRYRGRDLRLVCSKKLPAAAVLFRDENKGRRKQLNDAIGMNLHSCYPEITEKDEKALAKWLSKGPKETQNHFLPELGAWVRSAISAEILREQDARGEIRTEDVALCPEELPEGIEEFIRRTVLPEDRTLIYRKGNTKGLCFCCGQEVRAQFRQHFRQNEMVRCPNCGEIVTCYLNTSDRFKVDFVQNIATIQKGKDGKTLFIRQWHILRDHTAQWRDIPGQLKEICRYAVRGSHGAKWQREAKEAWGMNTYRYDLKGWNRVYNLSEVYDGSYYFFCPDNWQSVMNGTSLQYCSLAEYDGGPDTLTRNRNVIRFLMDWARYPMVEKFWKAGYTNIVHEKIAGISKEQRNTVIWTRPGFRQAVRFPQRLLKIHAPEEWTMLDFQKVTELWTLVQTGKLQEADVPDLARAMVDIEHIKDAMGHASVHKILRYVSCGVENERAQRLKEKGEAERQGRSYYMRKDFEYPATYRDYLKDCVKLHLNLDDPEVLFPKDLNAAHARTIAQVRYQDSQIKREQFEKQVKRLQWMAWEQDGLLIRPPVDGAELIAEGKYLHHCVGGYVERMADGKTTILLIRRTDAPDIPFYTLEWLNGRVQQCRTLKNASYEEDGEVLAFVTEWVEKVAKKGKKKKAATSAA